MGDIKVSVIVPIYNVEQYLRQCLDSIINQTLEDIEIICVDDGSPDNCGAIIDEYAQKDSRIVAIHKENGGYASAINKGLDIAKGEYIGIVESDDWIAPRMYELLYNKAIDANSDIVKGAIYYVEDSQNDVKKISQFVLNICDKNESFTLKECPEIIAYFASIWSAIYKKSFLDKHKIKMLEDIRPYEDIPFMAEVYSHSEKTTLIKTPVYYYRKDAQGSSNNTVKKTILNYITQRARNREIFIKNGCWDDNLKEEYWKIAYWGSKDFFNKPNNKYRKEFYQRMQQLFKIAYEDKCTFKYFSNRVKRDFKNIATLPYETYRFFEILKNFSRNIFSITRFNETHKTLTIFGIKIKYNVTLLKHRYIIKFLDKIVPKDRNLFVFSSFPDYSDNGKAFYDYMTKNHSEYELVWLLNDKASYDKVPKPCYKLNSIKGIWKLIRAKYTVETFFGFEKFISSKQKIKLQLWHGMPLKTIGYNEKGIAKYMFKNYKRCKSDYFFVSSDIFKLSMVSSFLMKPDNVFITGQPKTDAIFDNNNKEKISEYINLKKYSKVIIFAPTYKEVQRGIERDVKHEFNNIFYMDDYSKDVLYKYLTDNNILLLIKPHPFEEELYKQYLDCGELYHPNVRVIFNQDMLDNNIYFYEFFQFADLMITDFSSIGIDYLITKKPIIFLNSLAEDYNNTRGFILEDNYELLEAGLKAHNFAEMMNAINDTLTNDSYREKRLAQLPLLHKYCDSKASERIFNIMKNL